MSWILDTLIAKGYKKTTPREQIAGAIESHQGIFSVQFLIQKLKKMDKVSIYRTVELLATLDIIHPIANLDGVQYYELHGNTHHHHIVCTKCHTSACIDCDVPKISVRGFTNTHHTFLVTALCTECSGNS